MQFKKLTPYQVAELTKPRGVDRSVKRKRTNGLACYTPLGDVQASLRITGTRLDSDSAEMITAANYFANGLLQATTQNSPEVYRSLIGPVRYSDRVLGIYCEQLIKGALGPRQDLATYGPVSPCLVPYLLGGVTTKAVEELCYRALEVMEFFPDPPKALTLQKALSNVGFGPGIRHEDPTLLRTTRKFNHLSQRQDFLLNLPRGGSYAKLLIKDGAYGDSLHRLLLSWKDKVIAEAELLMDPQGGEMTELAAVGRHPINLNDVNYWRAVRKVFEQEWEKLDISGRPDDAVADGEVLMARKIIQRISYNDKMSAEALVGISLLTGISIANWTSFAVQDAERRGETFIKADEVDRAIDMIEMQAQFKCESELRGDALSLRIKERDTRRARRLKSTAWPLWSTTLSKSQLYVLRTTGDGLPVYKYKPLSLSSDK